jgi:hypothetical protein
VPVLENSSEAEVRKRTVTAVTPSKLVFIRAERIQKVRELYPELTMRLRR